MALVTNVSMDAAKLGCPSAERKADVGARCNYLTVSQPGLLPWLVGNSSMFWELKRSSIVPAGKGGKKRGEMKMEWFDFIC